MTIILKGENKHLVRRLLQVDGSPLLRTALADLRVALWQGARLRTTIVYGSAELIANPGDVAGNEVQLEITAALSASFTAGDVKEVWQLTMTDSAYIGGSRIDRLEASEIVIQ